MLFPDVFLLAAGSNTRMGKWSHWPKCLLPVDGKAVLGWILESWGPEFTFWIAVSQDDQLIESYVRTAYPDYVVNYVKINTEVGHLVGPSYSLSGILKEYERHSQQSPAGVVVSVTDGVYETIDLMDCRNVRWTLFGAYLPVEQQADYSNFSKGTTIDKLSLIEKNEASESFMSWAGVVYLPKCCVWSLEHRLTQQLSEFSNKELSFAELFLAMSEDINVDLVSLKFTDIGTEAKYSAARTTADLTKPNQLTYTNHSSRRVVKLWKTVADASAFSARGRNFEDNGCQYIFPRVSFSGHCAWYEHVPGVNLSDVVTPPRLRQFLNTMLKQLWQSPTGKRFVHEQDFTGSHLYWLKTQARLLQYIEKTSSEPAQDLLEGLSSREWFKTIHKSVQTPIHGDLTLDNVIVAPGGRYTLIDWRTQVTDNGRHGVRGDLYYDLAKIWVSLVINYPLMKSTGKVDSPDDSSLCLNVLKNFTTSIGLDYLLVCKYGVLLVAAMPAVHQHEVAVNLLAHAVKLFDEFMITNYDN